MPCPCIIHEVTVAFPQRRPPPEMRIARRVCSALCGLLALAPCCASDVHVTNGAAVGVAASCLRMLRARSLSYVAPLAGAAGAHHTGPASVQGAIRGAEWELDAGQGGEAGVAGAIQSSKENSSMVNKCSNSYSNLLMQQTDYSVRCARCELAV